MKMQCFLIAVMGLCSLLVFGAGCAPESRSDLPSSAVQICSGGKVVAFTAPHDGKAYLHDDTDNRVVYATTLRRDQVMRFDPMTGSVRIDGNAAPEGIPGANHDHSIYFDRSAPPDRADVTDRHVIDNAAPSIPTVRVPIGVQVDVQPDPSVQK